MIPEAGPKINTIERPTCTALLAIDPARLRPTSETHPLGISRKAAYITTKLARLPELESRNA
jgi:hypothetical protein